MSHEYDVILETLNSASGYGRRAAVRLGTNERKLCMPVSWRRGNRCPIDQVDFTAILTVDDEAITEMSDGCMKSPFAHMRAVSSQTGAVPAPTGSPNLRPQFPQVSSTAIDRGNDSRTEAANLISGFEVAVDGVRSTEAMVVAQKATIEFQLMALITNKSSSTCAEIMNIQNNGRHTCRELSA